MTKQDIINDVSSSTGLTKLETEIIMNGVMSTIINSLANNERVELRGFGTFGIKHRMPKKARNPGTGAPVYLPERYVPTFKPSKLSLEIDFEINYLCVVGNFGSNQKIV